MAGTESITYEDIVISIWENSLRNDRETINRLEKEISEKTNRLELLKLRVSNDSSRLNSFKFAHHL